MPGLKKKKILRIKIMDESINKALYEDFKNPDNLKFAVELGNELLEMINAHRRMAKWRGMRSELFGITCSYAISLSLAGLMNFHVRKEHYAHALDIFCKHVLDNLKKLNNEGEI